MKYNFHELRTRNHLVVIGDYKLIIHAASKFAKRNNLVFYYAKIKDGATISKVPHGKSYGSRKFKAHDSGLI